MNDWRRPWREHGQTHAGKGVKVVCIVGPCDTRIEWTELLQRCDAVLLTPDWQHSADALEAHALAIRMGMPVFYTARTLEAWVRAERRE